MIDFIDGGFRFTDNAGLAGNIRETLIARQRACKLSAQTPIALSSAYKIAGKP
jgi:hypothetical protein